MLALFVKENFALTTLTTKAQICPFRKPTNPKFLGLLSVLVAHFQNDMCLFHGKPF